ncbi:Putative uncharacterized transposon-derived protein [Frankliniella fusca]|uniref:Uncharacterized transposon-derived protein n=1 Tax=Frankliniella fusca TaxID=407009 RepID=A0AAE1HYN1_9NEOP|nr:Putative uncharacterized transposon-derived protein [Frankliniella fusca]
MAENLNELLWKLYTKPPSKSLFRSKETLRKNTNLKDSVLENFLLKQPVYTTFRSARRRFPTHGYDTLSKSGQLMQLDLLDLSKFSSENDGVRYLLVVIDAFSKKLYVRALKNKYSKTVALAMQDILREMSPLRPEKLSFDDGGEFKKDFRKLLEKEKIPWKLSVTSLHKAVFSERVNRTLRSLINKYIYHRQNQRYIDALGDLVKSYNSSTHRSTGFAPESVKKKNFYQIWSKRMLASYRNRIKERPPKFRIGDTVKVSVIRSSVFAKRTERNFSEENFTVVDIVLKRPKNIYLYTLKDSTGEIIEGGFYEYELTKALVDKETRYKIRSILGYKSIGGVKHALVWWEGFPRKAATYEPLSNLEAYNV